MMNICCAFLYTKGELAARGNAGGRCDADRHLPGQRRALRWRVRSADRSHCPSDAQAAKRDLPRIPPGLMLINRKKPLSYDYDTHKGRIIFCKKN